MNGVGGTVSSEAAGWRHLRHDLSVAVAVFLCYVFMSDRLHEALQAFVALILLGAVVFQDRLLAAWQTWACVAVTFGAAIAMRPLDMANHHFLLTYASLALAVSLSGSPEERHACLRTNARWLLVALMGVATLQRLLQPTFMGGGFIGYELATGGFCRPILTAFPHAAEIMAENRGLSEALRRLPPGELGSVTLAPPFPGFELVTMSFVVAILAIEAWICLTLLLFPRKLLPHLSILVFAGTLAVLRQELTFISVVCMLGLFGSDPERKVLRAVYGILGVLFAVAPLKV
jgi:hypothetical protein